MSETTRLYAFDGPKLDDPHAVQLELDAADWELLDKQRARDRRLGDEVGRFLIVTDQATGESWWVASAACGLGGCHCAAVAIRVESGATLEEFYAAVPAARGLAHGNEEP